MKRKTILVTIILGILLTLLAGALVIANNTVLRESIVAGVKKDYKSDDEVLLWYLDNNESATAKLLPNGTLEIHGKLDTGREGDPSPNRYTFDKNGRVLWYEHKDKIKKVIIRNVYDTGTFTFAGCSNLTTVDMADVWYIGEGTFAGCNNLTTLNMGNNVLGISLDAFYGCTSLQSLTLSNKLSTLDNAFTNSGVRTIKIPASINYFSFENGTSITNVILENGVKEIGNNAFLGCSSLTSVTIPGSVKKIGTWAFADCVNLTNITIPGSVTDFGSGIFNGCIKLSNVKISEGVKVIKAGMFGYCRNLKQVKIPNSVTTIGYSSFLNCESLENVVLPNNLKIIEYNAFLGCDNLTNVVIPNSVTTIGDDAFGFCDNLKVLEFPSNLTSLGELNCYFSMERVYVYDNMNSAIKQKIISYFGSSVKTVLEKWDISSTTNDNVVARMCKENILEISGSGYMKNFDSSNIPWASYKSSIKKVEIIDEINNIGSYAFYNFTSLNNITGLNKVKGIGNSTFKGCTGLTKIEIPSKITLIANYAFDGCTNLKQVIFQNGITTIGLSAFSKCSSLTNIVFPKSLTSLGDYTFSKCINLKDVTIQNGITTMGTGVFSECSSLTNITFPKSLTSLGNYTFDKCTKLTRIYAYKDMDVRVLNKLKSDYGDKVKSVLNDWNISATTNDNVIARLLEDNTMEINGKGSMKHFSAINIPWNTDTYKSNIKKLIILGEVNNIGDYAFYACSNLANVEISDKVTSIGTNAFCGCVSLTHVDIPNSVKNIGNRAFWNCTKLITIQIPTKVTGIGNEILKDSSNLKSIYVYNIAESSVRQKLINAYGSKVKIMLRRPYDISATDTDNVLARMCEGNVLEIVGTGNMKSHSLSDSVQWEKEYKESINSVIIYDKVNNIGKYVFESHKNLQSIEIADSVRFLGEGAFYGCSSLEEITLPSKITNINDFTFYACSNLTNIKISNKVESIGTNVFCGCKSLTHLDIPNSVKDIGSRAFWNCTKLTTITIPQSVTSIGSEALSSSGIKEANVFCSSYGDKYIKDNYSNIKIVRTGHPEGSGDEQGELPATCTTNGCQEGVKCTICEEWVSGGAITPALGHEYSKGYIIDVEATCTTQGYQSKHCVRCDSKIEGAIIMPTGHTEVIDEAVEPTETTAGKTEGKHCSTCNAILIYPKEIPALGTVVSGEWDISAPVEEGETANSVTAKLYDGTLEISGTGAMNDYNISDETKKAPWSNVAESIKKVIIKSGVTNIGDYAFYTDATFSKGCINLEEVIIYGNLTKIGINAFNGCSKLTSINIKNSVNSIGDYAFTNCTSLTSINIPSGITNIGYGVFYGCTSLKSINISSSVTTILKRAFLNCSSLEEVTIPESVTNINEEAFVGCGDDFILYVYNTSPIITELKDEYGSQVIEIYGEYDISTSISNVRARLYADNGEDFEYSDGTLVISGNGNMTNFGDINAVVWKDNYEEITNVIIEEGIENIGEYAFASSEFAGFVSNIQEITIPSSVNKIGKYAFSNSKSLKEVILPENLTYIGNQAFTGCSAITTITIPEKVEYIGTNAFGQCSELAQINVNENNIYYYSSSEDGVLYNKEKTEIVCYPEGKTEEKFIIPETVTIIDNYAFYRATNLKNIILSENVSEIGQNSFGYCASIENIIIPENVSRIRNQAFSNCSALKEITIRGKDISTGSNVFLGCDVLETVNVYCDSNVKTYFEENYSEVNIELMHTEVENEAQEVTCTQTGYATYKTCENCDYTTKEEITATGHNITLVEAIDATCVNDGNVAHYACSNCNKIFLDEEGNNETTNEDVTIEAAGHEEVIEEAVAATCTTAGKTEGKYCSVCNEVLVAQEEIPATGHSYGEWEIIEEATQNAAGKKTRTCSICGSVEEQDIPKVGAELTSISVSQVPTKIEYVIAVESLDLAGGKIELTYSDGTVQTKYMTEEGVKATGFDNSTIGEKTITVTYEEKTATFTVEIIECYHNYGDWNITKNPTCEGTGTKERTCTICDNVETETIQANGHLIMSYEEKAPTCAEIGWDAYEECENCDHTTYEEIPALGHTWGEWEETIAPTEETMGEETRTCSVCGDTEIQNIPALGATLESISVTRNPSKTEYIQKAENIDLTGGMVTLTYSNGSTLVKFMTETGIGVTGFDNSTIGEIPITVTYEGKEATFTVEVVECTHEGEWYITKEATCIEDGEKQLICTICKEELKETIPASEELHIEGIPQRENEVPASCENDGSYDEVVKCTVCNTVLSTEEKTLDKLEHIEEIIPVAEPTCTQTGLTAGTKCSICEAIIVAQEEIPAVGHIYTSYESNGDATCTEDGTETSKCDNCDEEDTRVDEGSKLEHSWGDWEVTIQPTETTKGEEKRTCNTCGTEETKEIQEIGHTHNHTSEITAPTCTEEGYTTYTCSCGDTYIDDEVEALGHDLVNHEAQAATCTEKGWNAYETCTRCDYTTYEEIALAEHTAGSAIRENEVQATCENNGSYEEVVKCTKCNTEISREEKTIEKLGHTEETIPGAAATCTQTGKTEGKRCTVCGTITVAQQEIQALGHDIVNHEAQAATCTEKGWNAYETCTRCDYTTYEEIALAEHTAGSAIRENEVQATCENNGSYEEVVKCTKCNTEISREEKTIEKLGHTEEKIPAEAATCTQSGKTEGKRCTVCGTITVAQQETQALGHDIVNHEAQAVTCTEKGWDAYQTCTRCTYTTYVEKPAIGHEYSEEWTVDDPGSCTEDTVKSKHCTICDARTEITRFAPLGHIYNTVVTNATCTEGGYTTYTCEKCSHSYIGNEVEALGHDIVNHEAQAVTCTEKGWDAYQTCTRCTHTTYVEKLATGHDYSTEFTIDKAATCAEEGSQSKHCTRCDSKTEETVIEKVAHSFGAWTIDKEATYDEEGHKYRTCTSCNKETQEETIAKLTKEEIEVTTNYEVKEENNIKFVISNEVTTAKEILNNVTAKAELRIVNKEGKELSENDKVGTGTKVVTKDNEEIYTIVVNGDSNCDGEITFRDIIRANAIRINKAEGSISTAELFATDIDRSSKIEFRDIIRMNAIRINSLITK